MTGFQIIEVSIGLITLLCFLGIWKAITSRVGALMQLVGAQSTPDADDSLLIRLKHAIEAVSRLEKTLERMEETQKRESEHAKNEWQMLHEEDAAIMGEVKPLQKLAADLQLSLPAALQRQNEMGQEQNKIRSTQVEVLRDVGQVKADVERLKAKVFGDDK